MEYVITSGALTARVDTRGAQLRALKYKDTDYLWPGGDAWGWSAPVCCPWCGAVEGGAFGHAGKTYAAGRHGFVRESEHELAERGGDTLAFTLRVGEGDARWPWPFELRARYALDGCTLALR